jgi:sugar (pentulose or hexulose) kinase
MVPFLSGERSPGFREGAVGATYGFTKETTPAHFMKSCLEGVALRLNAVLHLILKASFDSPSKSSAVPVVVASGKALEVNHVWRQMIADCSGMKIILDQDSEEGTSRGVARLVAAAITSAKWTTDKQSIIPKEESIHIMTQSIPRDLATNRYRYASERQEKLIGSVTPLFGRNTCLQD